MEHDGNGWVECGLGHRHWGRFGAAGLLLRWAAVDGSLGRILLQHRAYWTADGGTWGVPGGARDSHESALDAALREAGEETGVPPDVVAPYDELLDDHGGGWSYTTVLAELRRPIGLVAQEESEELRWVDVAGVDALPLHHGFAGTWPELRRRLTARVEADQRDGTGAAGTHC